MSVNYLSSTEWGKKQTPPITRRRASKLCKDGRIEGVQKVGSNYMIPEDSIYDRMPARSGASV